MRGLRLFLEGGNCILVTPDSLSVHNAFIEEMVIAAFIEEVVS